MKNPIYALAGALALGAVSIPVLAQDGRWRNRAGPPASGRNVRRSSRTRARSSVPAGYKVGVFAAGLDTITSITVDKSDNVWVAISGNTFGFPPEGIDKPHVKIFDKSGKLIRDNVGLGMFKSFALNEIGYCAENGRTYVGDYSYGIWEIDGVNGTPKLIMNEVPIGDHALGGITCRDGWLYYAVGAPTNSGFSDPNIHGWTDAVDPYWEKRTPDGVPPLPRDPPCRDIVLTGLNIRDSEGNLTGAFLPKGTPSKPGQVIKAQTPCGGAIHRAKLKADSSYTTDDWEVYAMGLRNSSGLAFGPKGSRFENALAVSDNGHNDKGNRRVANGAEKLFIVTEKGQDAGFPDKEGLNFVNIKRFGPDVYRGNKFDPTRPNPQLNIGDRAVRSDAAALSVHRPLDRGSRHAADRGQSQPQRLHQPGAGMGHQQPDGRAGVVAKGLRLDRHALHRRVRHHRQRSGKPAADVAGDREGRVPQPDRRQVVDLRREHRSGAKRLPEEGKPRRIRAHQRRRVQQRRQDDVRCGLRRAVRELPDGIAVLHDAEVAVVWTITKE